jgi:hypothetical protein
VVKIIHEARLPTIAARQRPVALRHHVGVAVRAQGVEHAGRVAEQHPPVHVAAQQHHVAVGPAELDAQAAQAQGEGAGWRDDLDAVGVDDEIAAGAAVGQGVVEDPTGEMWHRFRPGWLVRGYSIWGWRSRGR